MPRARRFEVFTCDRGRKTYDANSTDLHTLTEIVQEVVDSRFWVELDQIPVDVIARCLPNLALPRSTRRLLEIWIEERGAKPRRSA